MAYEEIKPGNRMSNEIKTLNSNHRTEVMKQVSRGWKELAGEKGLRDYESGRGH